MMLFVSYFTAIFLCVSVPHYLLVLRNMLCLEKVLLAYYIPQHFLQEQPSFIIPPPPPRPHPALPPASFEK